MKKYLSIAILFILLICSGVVSAAGDSDSQDLMVTFTDNPMIVAPGTNGYLELNLKSAGSSNIQNIDITVSSWDSSVVIPQGNWDVYLGDLSGGHSTSVLYEYKIANDASAGLYQVVFKINYYPGNGIVQTAIIKVEDSTSLDLVSVIPSTINIGQATTLIFNITNGGGVDANNVLFTWEDPSDYILPLGTDNKIKISSIKSGESTEIPVEVLASPSTSPGIYPLSITMEYYDSTGTMQTINSQVGLQIGGTTDFAIVLQESSDGSTTFAVANTGAYVASSVIVTVPSQMGVTISGASSVNVGNLDAGDYTLATFTLSTSFSANDATEFPTGFDPSGFSNASGMPQGFNRNFENRTTRMTEDSKIIVEVSYTDMFGIRQTVEKEVAITTSSSAMSGTFDTSSLPSDFSSRFQMREGTTTTTSEGLDTGSIYILIGIIGIVAIVLVLKFGKIKSMIKKKK